MRNPLRAIAVLAIFVSAGVLGVASMMTPVQAACEPVACPAIAKICPSGELACRTSPCSCALACVPDQGQGCKF